MSCLKVLGNEAEGSDIDFSIRYREFDGTYPAITDASVTVDFVFESVIVETISIGSPSANGSAVTIETDATSEYISVHISGDDTIDRVGDFNVFVKIDSANTGIRTEAKGTYRICNVGI